jgi:hypothetical protein
MDYQILSFEISWKDQKLFFSTISFFFNPGAVQFHSVSGTQPLCHCGACTDSHMIPETHFMESETEFWSPLDPEREEEKVSSPAQF